MPGNIYEKWMYNPILENWIYRDEETKILFGKTTVDNIDTFRDNFKFDW